jgi:hypothetical protein
MGDTSWAFLLVGSFAAMGAAMTAGTLAALLRHRRTGTMPGSDEQVELSPARRRMLWLRIVIGLVLTAAGIEALRRIGIL